ncbi:amidohydrolase [Paenibacillus thermoaerophilus]|uniref:5-methylthioadenosine/S-adenosylhomocysteine deaminase n=1 Tax=Paenibacillus thermoaerophilus TaxID=1215385 RepID=A0ABW2V308_9BACL|nr:amidohydrolase [Paenibacillus thermoaerophilus]TMV18668.1 amidohydrolase [Paenibacillus thermoaerophilus]
MSRWWIDNGLLLTMSDAAPVIRGYMCVENGRITYIGQDRPQGDAGERVDGRGKLYMPGLVNTHNHAAMSLLRGFGDDLALQVWLETKMWPNEAKFTDEDVRWGTLLSIVEMLKSGTTCFVDMYDHMDEVAQAVAESGIRGCLTRGVIGLCPPDVQTAKLEEAIRFARTWQGAADGRITTMLSPHSPYTCPPDYIERIVEAAHDLDVPLHTHMSETRREVEQNVEQYGLRPPAHLAKLGVFSRPCLVAHGVHLTDEEIELLAEHRVHVSHNPGSNLKLASGIARVPDLLRAGVRVSLGTDSSASNNNLDMFEEIRLAALLAKGSSFDPTALPAAQALKLGTVEGARSIWLNDVGTLEVGMQADVISIDVEQPHYYPQTDYISHIVYAGSGADVRDVWVQGRQVVRNRECLLVDEEKIRREAQACYQRLTGN